MENLKYRGKIYKNDNLDIAYYAKSDGQDILIVKVEKYLNANEFISTYCTTLNNEIVKNSWKSEIVGDEKYLISKTEYKRIYEKYRQVFISKCA